MDGAFSVENDIDRLCVPLGGVGGGGSAVGGFCSGTIGSTAGIGATGATFTNESINSAPFVDGAAAAGAMGMIGC